MHVTEGHVQAWAPQAYRALAQEWPLRAVSTGGLPWTEIDFPEDLERARLEVVPAIVEGARTAGRMTGGSCRRPIASRRQWWVSLAAGAGVAVLVWTIASVGPDKLLQQARGLGAVLPLVLLLAGARFALQAAGWRLAMDERQRPGGAEAFAAVVAGEAAGYFAWGPVSKEPVKALLVGHRLPERTALAAAVVERFAYSAVATMLMIAAVVILAIRTGHVTWLAARGWCNRGGARNRPAAAHGPIHITR